MWKVEHTPEGTVRLRSSWAGGRCVDTVGIGAEVGAVLQIWQEVPAVVTSCGSSLGKETA